MAVTAGHFRFGPDSGRLLIRTSRAGVAAMAGHDLTLEITGWSAEARVPGDTEGGLAAAVITARADLGSLAVREGTGGAKPLSQGDRAEIDRTARRILGGGEATFGSARVITSGAGGAIEGALTLNDRTQPLRLQVSVPSPGRFRGVGRVRQTAFGIKPYTAFFGALKLQDEVEVEFEADLDRAKRPDAG